MKNTKPERVIGRQRFPIRKEKERQKETKETKRDKRCRIDTCVYWMLASEKGAPAWSTYRVHIVVVEHLVIDCSLI